MISFQFASFFTVCALADQSPWEGISCGTFSGSPTQTCQYGLEKIHRDPNDPTSGFKCCQKGLGSTYDDCKCLPCADLKPCDSTQSARQNAYDQYKAMNFSDADAQAASETYICVWNSWWPIKIPEDVKPVFKCCESVEGDHKCKCPPKDDTKKCYSKWANPDLEDCDFGKSESGEYCCLENGVCKGFTPQGDLINNEGFTDWAGCWGSSQEDCESKAQQTRILPNEQRYTQQSGCVYDVSPIQKYCGLTVENESQCQDARPKNFSNNCGLGAISDTEWFVNSRANAKEGERLEFAAIQAVKLSNPYCGSWWIDHPVTGKQALLV
jgi:hypothetical protein